MNRFKTDEEFNKAKDQILEKVVMWEFHRDLCEQPIRLTFDDLAILFAPDKDHILSKMAICKVEQKALSKLRSGLKKVGVDSLDDALDLGRYRENAKAECTREI